MMGKEIKAELEKSVAAKVDYEYERFLLDMQRTSKNNIIAKAEEISAKKKIKFCLRLNLEYLDAQELELLNAEENLLETICRYLFSTVQDITAEVNQVGDCIRKILDRPEWL